MSRVYERGEEAFQNALKAANGREADLVVSDGPLRQTLIALKKGTILGEHNSPPAASILVIRGSIQVIGEDNVVLTEGDLVALTHQRHSVEALSDSLFLLTTVTSVPGANSHSGAQN